MAFFQLFRLKGVMLQKLISYTTALIMLAASVGCGIAYRIIGSTIDSQGYLHEAFGLIPIGWICFLSALIIAALSLIRTLVHR